MLTGFLICRCLVCGKCVRGITHVHPPLYPLVPCCALTPKRFLSENPYFATSRRDARQLLVGQE
jgi:hypothetical protein